MNINTKYASPFFVYSVKLHARGFNENSRKHDNNDIAALLKS